MARRRQQDVEPMHGEPGAPTDPRDPGAPEWASSGWSGRTSRARPQNGSSRSHRSGTSSPGPQAGAAPAGADQRCRRRRARRRNRFQSAQGSRPRRRRTATATAECARLPARRSPPRLAAPDPTTGAQPGPRSNRVTAARSCGQHRPQVPQIDPACRGSRERFRQPIGRLSDGPQNSTVTIGLPRFRRRPASSANFMASSISVSTIWDSGTVLMTSPLDEDLALAVPGRDTEVGLARLARTVDHAPHDRDPQRHGRVPRARQ